MQLQRTNTILYCHHWAATVAFYREVLQLAVAHETDWFIEFRLTAESYLSVADERRATIASVGGQGITLSWQVADLDRHRAMLEQHGITLTPTKRKWGARLFYLHDPEGHRIELWEPLAREKREEPGP